MVGPSLTEEERDVANRWLKVGFVSLVAASGALTAVHAGGSPPVIAAGFAVGLALGAALLWFLLRSLAEFRPSAGGRHGR